MTADATRARQRLFVHDPITAGCEIELAPEQSHYLEHVMRLKPGTPVKVFNGRDGEWLGTISELRKKKGRITAETLLREQGNEAGPTLVFAPIKKQRLDFLIEKAVELGVGKLQPVITQHGITDKVRLDRLQAQVIEAAEQCERLTVPDVAEPVRLLDWVANGAENHHLLFCDETGSGSPIGEVTSQLLAKGAGSVIDNINVVNHALVIGPEGGFSADELERIRKQPFATPVSLGPRILRAETAAIAALTVYQDRIGDWSHRPVARD
ncbi:MULTISPECIES: 16S rRNA (uracil(1498)-N(3))-methyltransferase [Thalassospira]|uniref:Ribosomal RNA small subunit methyltransferase E n=2 Tax=Thalassospira TaxID=168934 RepID=A0A367W2N1_9PROT|nr:MULTISPECIES: 16S rRNA (uracil(1498)-N(3))-methyltransferase [Thalassospira]MDG4718428.1 16S rRNA (uracil(1498)-N(3))-methyltransferase [Thalassospira sp. FZY0004]RCK34654.1 16S rRNA methyltransferase [Thalassospira profundimaris]